MMISNDNQQNELYSLKTNQDGVINNRSNASGLKKHLKYPICFYRFKSLKKFESTKIDYLEPPYGSNLLTQIIANQELRETFADILEPFDLELMLRSEYNEIDVLKSVNKIRIATPFNLIAETFQKLFMFLAAIETNQQATLIFEEPENRLFPYYTKYLAERLTRNRNENQFFFSTHNPYFFSTILTKAKEKDLKIFLTYYQDKQTKISELDLKKLSEFEDYYSIFFNLDSFIEG